MSIAQVTELLRLALDALAALLGHRETHWAVGMTLKEHNPAMSMKTGVFFGYTEENNGESE